MEIGGWKLDAEQGPGCTGMGPGLGVGKAVPDTDAARDTRIGLGSCGRGARFSAGLAPALAGPFRLRIPEWGVTCLEPQTRVQWLASGLECLTKLPPEEQPEGCTPDTWGDFGVRASARLVAGRFC